MRSIFFTVLTMACCEYVLGQDRAIQLRVVPSVDISRYIGTWYEIARLPNRFQDDCEGDVVATYTLLEDGVIKVVNRCRKAGGKITEAVGRAKKAGNGEPDSKLKVRFAPAFLSFLPFVWGNYWIIDLADDYSYAVVGEPDRKYFWVLSRTPKMNEETFQAVLDRARMQGYDLSTLINTEQNE
jgi:apolipoprotein D and lipocalin family protein